MERVVLPRWLWRRRRLLIAASDAGAWVVGIAMATWFRYDWRVDQIDGRGLVTIALLAVVCQWALGALTGMYRGRYWTASVEDVLQLTAVICGVGLVIFGANLALPAPWIPRSVPLTAVLVTLAAGTGVRLGIRLLREHLARPDHRSARRVLVFGAGDAGRQLIRSMLTRPEAGYLPVAIIDDDPHVRHARFGGVPVLGGRDSLAAVIDRVGPALVVIAVPTAGPDVVMDISKIALDAGISVKVLPPLSELLSSYVGLGDLRDLHVDDLLGRHQVDTDLAQVAGYLLGKRVLVTGAGGSIGSELCRQIHRFGPSELMMLDRDESALHGVSLSIYGRALLDSSDVILADIRDADAVRRIFLERRPQVVFHAAALKHLPMLQQYPSEAWKTNVLGTVNVLEAARDAGVPRFVNISTDKAANPTSVLGYSKRIGERLTASVAGEVDGVYLSVRFGNVLGSRGSVIITFREQIAGGGPVTVTDPNVTRFFMTVTEAVQLVIQAAAIGRAAEALVLDMGTPVRIDDVARQLIALSERAIPIVYTGLRNGEKMHEELFGSYERDHRPFHAAISHVTVPPLPVIRLRDTDRRASFDAADLLAALSTDGGQRVEQGSAGPR